MDDSRYQVSVQDYIDYHQNGYIIVRNLVSQDEVEEIRQHTEDLMYGRITIDGMEPPPSDLTVEEMGQHWLRIHMLHRKHELHERYMLQPYILDILEALIGPDVLALQTMLFLKAAGQEGQGKAVGSIIQLNLVSLSHLCLFSSIQSHASCGSQPAYPN